MNDQSQRSFTKSSQLHEDNEIEPSEDSDDSSEAGDVVKTEVAYVQGAEVMTFQRSPSSQNPTTKQVAHLHYRKIVVDS